MSYLITLIVVIGALVVGLQFFNATETGPRSEPSDTSTTEVMDSIESARDAKELVEERSESRSTFDSTLDMSGQRLTKVPNSVFERTDIEVLDLSNNMLDGALQAEVRHLQNLRVLDLSDNNFTGVPAEVGQLSRLEVLDLSNNPITGLPYEIGNLKNLKVLDLRGTNYASQDLTIIRQGLLSDVEIRVDR